MRPSKRATKTALATLGWSALWLVLLGLCRLAVPEVEPPLLESVVFFGVPSLIVALTWWLIGREERETDVRRAWECNPWTTRVVKK